ncbi:MAG: AsnC family transcriptional regulator [Betaproteobacteria bacterium HGW-Betaproteobacteria-13]|jgi:Lrp/AsnC family leucine-responsive transcriptional regulator|nr:MAG: AsnC family transcriptional regulator [Betaproteobacteria bacterium HGW-Betaproteobacteria-13]|tara:strand:- start:255092 stop:255589 length:498 start_codon:yes stop_codon:yes gene_type:complete
MIDLDKYDLQLLSELQTDGQASNAVLAERIHLSPSQVSRRVQRLEQSGFIERYVALLRPAAVGLGVTAFVNVSLERHGEVHTDAFTDAIRDMEEVLECFAISGEADYLLRVMTPSLPALSDFMLHRLMRIGGVRSVKSNIALTELKRSTRLPLDHLGNAPKAKAT